MVFALIVEVNGADINYCSDSAIEYGSGYSKESLEKVFEIRGLNYHQEDVFLKLINKNIVLKPGTQFFFMDLDDVTFFEDSGCIWMNYARKTKENTYLLTCQ